MTRTLPFVVGTILLNHLLGCGLEVKTTLAPPRQKSKAPTPTQTTEQTIRDEAVQSGSAKRQHVPATTANEISNAQSAASNAAAITAADTTGTPKLIAETTQYDFGRMDPFTRGSHKFQIQNIGDGPLVIRDDRSSCKCTASDYPRRPIAPGETAEVVVTWEVQANHPNFQQSATLITNDPVTTELELEITGEVILHVGADPPELNFGDIRPGNKATCSTTIVSQVWEAFEISNVETSLEGATWSIQPAAADALKQLNARSGYQLTLNLPPLPRGHFKQWIRFQAEPLGDVSDSESEANRQQTFEVPISGKVLRRLAVYGPGVQHTGTVDLGVVDSRQGLQQTLFVKVYDAQPELEVKAIHATPECLNIAFEPDAQRHQQGLYRLQIEIPPHSTPGRFNAGKSGELSIEFQHPRISELQLRVSFAIASFVASVPQ